MNNQPLSHDDATALIAGSPPPDRPDLVTLAAAIDDLRDAFAEPAPQPSPELADWLTGAQPLPLHGTEATATGHTPVRTHTGALTRRIRATARALAALGVTTKIALGGTAALAAVASAGAVGVLPQAPQAVFNRIVDNDQADTPLPRTPLNDTPETSTRRGARSDEASGGQLHTEQRSPGQGSSEPQDRDSDDRSQDVTMDAPRGGSDPAPDRDETDDSDHSNPESQKDADQEPDDQSDDQPDEEPEYELDDESEDEVDEERADDESDEEPDDADDRQAGDTEELDDSSNDAAEADGWSNSIHDAEDVE